MFGINMRVLRVYMGGVFAISSLICTFLAFWLVQQTYQVQKRYAFSHPGVLLADLAFPALAVIYAVAFWTIWKERPSARGLGIVASILQILLPLRQIVVHSWHVRSYDGIVLALGIVGLIVFSMREGMVPEEDNSEPEGNPS